MALPCGSFGGENGKGSEMITVTAASWLLLCSGGRRAIIIFSNLRPPLSRWALHLYSAEGTASGIEYAQSGTTVRDRLTGLLGREPRPSDFTVLSAQQDMFGQLPTVPQRLPNLTFPLTVSEDKE